MSMPPESVLPASAAPHPAPDPQPPTPQPPTRPASLSLDTVTDHLRGLGYGGDYNPEQWPEGLWAEDARLMQAAGVNLVSLGIFSWAKLEPRPGERDWGWLDRLMDLLHAHGVRVNLATATASPPPWMAKLDPESLPVTADGVRLGVGARQQYCPSSRTYREYGRLLTRDLAQRYGAHPALAAWHVNNEYGCHVWECFCDHCAHSFRAWLERRYVTLDALNAAWGTAFWSQHYAGWDEINPPRQVSGLINPTQQLDWRRFSSDNILELHDGEMAILSELTPDVPRATNFLGFLPGLDYWTWGQHQDFIATDVYTDPLQPEPHIDGALAYDLARSLGGGAPWALMEQTSSLVNWRPVNGVKAPGVMRLWSLQAVARGADAVMFFQWRASRAGAEKFHGAMLPHAGPDTRTHREIQALGADLGRLESVRGSRVVSEVALIHDWESWWALELGSKPSERVRQLPQLAAHHAALYRAGLTADLAHPERDLSGYRLVVIPNLYLLTDAAAENIRRYVQGGGTVVVGFFSGIVDGHEHIRLGEGGEGGYPAPWREMFGLSVEEFVPLGSGDTLPLTRADEGVDGATLTADLWSEVIRPQGAEVLASFGAGWLSGSPAVTRHTSGQGHAYYAGTRLDASGLDWLLGQAIRDAGVRPALDVPAGVEVVTRSSDGQKYLFVLNHSGAPQMVSLPSGRDLLTDTEVDGNTPLDVNGARVVRVYV